MELEQTSLSDWISKRVIAVESEYSVYDVLVEHGVELVDQQISLQIACPFPDHGPDNRPSARYYAPGGGRPGALHCFKCKYHLTTVNLYAKLKSVKFMEALHELERRFHIRIPRRPESHTLEQPSERSSTYTSPQWSDVNRVIPILENRLVRLRQKIPMHDFVKFCRVIDAVRWDFEHAQNQSSPDMILALQKVRTLMQTAEEEADAADGLQNSPEHG